MQSLASVKRLQKIEMQGNIYNELTVWNKDTVRMRKARLEKEEEIIAIIIGTNKS